MRGACGCLWSHLRSDCLGVGCVAPAAALQLNDHIGSIGRICARCSTKRLPVVEPLARHDMPIGTVARLDLGTTRTVCCPPRRLRLPMSTLSAWPVSHFSQVCLMSPGRLPICSGKGWVRFFSLPNHEVRVSCKNTLSFRSGIGIEKRDNNQQHVRATQERE